MQKMTQLEQFNDCINIRQIGWQTYSEKFEKKHNEANVQFANISE